MKIALRITKSAALMAGKDRYGWTVVEVPAGELTERQREALSRRTNPANTTTVHADFWLHDHTNTLTEATDESVKTVLDAYAEAEDVETARRAKTAKEKRLATQRTIDERLTNTQRYFGHPNGNSKTFSANCSAEYQKLTPHWPYPVDSDVANSVDAKAFESDLGDINAARLAGAVKEAKENLAERDRQLHLQAEEDQAIEDARAAQIEEWVYCQGDANQQERFTAGLLPDSEGIDALRDCAFLPLDGYARYDRSIRDEFCSCDFPDDTNCQVNCDVEEEPLSSGEWDTLKLMRSLAGDKNVTLVAKSHSCRTDECDETLERKAVHASATVGAFTFTRLYAL